MENFWTNYHSHSHFCDGKEAIEAYVKKAIDLNVLSFGISSHAPVSFQCKWCMNHNDMPSYLNQIKALQESYQSRIEIYTGLEVDYIPNIVNPLETKEKYHLDFTVGSIHFIDAFKDGTPWEIDGTYKIFEKGLHEIFRGNVEKVIRKYFELTREMVEHYPPDIVGHLDKIKIQNRSGVNDSTPLYDENSRWYQEEIDQTLKAIQKKGIMVEINTRGLYTEKTSDLYPGFQTLQKMNAYRIPITLNSDAHHPDQIIRQFPESAKILKEAGYREVKILKENQWMTAQLSENGLMCN